MIILKHIRRKNRKIKFDEDRYIEKYYMNENKVAVIPVELESERDLYMIIYRWNYQMKFVLI